MDLLYWVCAGLLVFAGIYRINQGILRSFLFLGIISGAFLTYLTIKPLFEKNLLYNPGGSCQIRKKNFKKIYKLVAIFL